MVDILIAKKEGEKMQIKVVKNMNKGYAPHKYLKVVNFKDFNDLALLFEDMDMLLNAPVEKAFRRYKENKDRAIFPF